MSPTGKASLLLPVAGLLASASLLLFVSLSGPFAPGFAAVCLSIGSVFSLATALVFLFVFRRTAPIFRHRVAVAAGLLSGFTGFLVIQLHCPLNELLHMLTGHALLPLLWGLAAYFISRLAFR